MNVARILVFFVLVSLAHADLNQEKEKLTEYYRSLDSNINFYLKNDIEMIEKNKEAIKKKIINTLARKMVYSSVNVNEDYITNEEDVFNNEMFAILSRIFKGELIDLNERYTEKLGKMQALDQVLNDLKKKVSAIEEKHNSYEAMETKIQDVQRYAKVDDRVRELIASFSKGNDSDILTIDLEGIVPPFVSYSLVRNGSSDYTLLEPLKDNGVHAVLDGKIVFLEESSSMGYIVVLKHRTNIFSIYSNLNSIENDIHIGLLLEASQLIGRVEGPLYFKLTQNENVLDPALFLELP